LGSLLIVQLGLGIASSLIRMVTRDAPQPTLPVVWITTAHVAAGALLLGGTWVLTLLAYRALRTPQNDFGHSRSSGEVWV